LAPITNASDGTESAFSVDGIIEQKKRNYGLNGAVCLCLPIAAAKREAAHTTRRIALPR
jgi:hypothetical protein